MNQSQHIAGVARETMHERIAADQWRNKHPNRRNSTALESALEHARDYRSAAQRGDAVRARSERETIEMLVGGYQDGRFALPAQVRETMGL